MHQACVTSALHGLKQLHGSRLARVPGLEHQELSQACTEGPNGLLCVMLHPVAPILLPINTRLPEFLHTQTLRKASLFTWTEYN